MQAGKTKRGLLAFFRALGLKIRENQPDCGINKR